MCSITAPPLNEPDIAWTYPGVRVDSRLRDGASLSGARKRARHVLSACVSFSLLSAFFVASACVAQPATAERPNILLIMADDLGYSDIGSYGGEIETPNLDRLAAEGVRFSHFRASPMCMTSRVALLSGMSFFAAGQGYERVKPLPQTLREAGYLTAVAGKWHASNRHPLAPGFFDRFHGFLSGMTDCYKGGSDWFLEDAPFRDFGPDFDATTVITERSIHYMGEALDAEQPFFMFVSYNAPHHPLQARRETVEKYLGRYLDGFTAIREQRLERQRAMGLIDADFVPAPAEIAVRPWEQMTDFRRQVEDRRMAAYAAMVDEMDQGVGRLLAYLEAREVLDGTVVIFLSDNGGYYNHGDIRSDHLQIPWQPGSNQTVSSGWAWVQNTPFNLYKQTAHEGGLAVPFLIRWPEKLEPLSGSITDLPAEMTDLYPTFAEIAGVDYPAEWGGETLKPLTGQSFFDALVEGEPFVAPPRFHAFLNPLYHESRAWIEGDYKLVAMHNGPWQLFDLANDRGETTDLSELYPEKRSRMADDWHHYAESIGVPKAARVQELEEQQNWGWQRLLMFSPHLTQVYPNNSSLVPAGLSSFEMRFSRSIDLPKTGDPRIRLFKMSDEERPVWDIALAPSHLWQGKRVLRVEELPALEADTHYYFLIDGGTFRVGGQPVGVLNDGAYWWRFRTAAN